METVVVAAIILAIVTVMGCIHLLNARHDARIAVHPSRPPPTEASCPARVPKGVPPR
ncbi:hypothetical protein OG393_27365 [Streptomyces sp. NBC_01216]|uniref:hypothetical protein n=1 Tax=Streptomyces sp. NBC_01216 TaxID=2903778 RepID=UPI002E1188AD|nr:hypothetical protein OG393_27365 [Streptomyces sp. NBC_01216]